MKRWQRGRGGQTLFWILSLLVALSMVCGTVLIVLPGPQRRVQPTPTTLPIQPSATHTLTTPSSPLTAMPTPTPAVAPSPLPQPTP